MLSECWLNGHSNHLWEAFPDELAVSAAKGGRLIHINGHDFGNEMSNNLIQVWCPQTFGHMASALRKNWKDGDCGT